MKNDIFKRIVIDENYRTWEILTTLNPDSSWVETEADKNMLSEAVMKKGVGFYRKAFKRDPNLILAHPKNKIHYKLLKEMSQNCKLNLKFEDFIPKDIIVFVNSYDLVGASGENLANIESLPKAA